MILTDEDVSARPLLPCRGLLVIGDPHLSSRRPGRRTDPDWPAPILGKLAHCVALANARDLAPVLLGDLFERPVEPDESLKARLVRLLKAFRHRPLANVGNHDKAHTRLSDGDSLAVLALADVLDLRADGGPAARYDVDGRRIGVGMTPFGEAIPEDVRGLIPGADEVVWLTHHDLAFDRRYPGALPPPPIAGCGLAINGHVHARQKPLTAGGTRWFNPGNITRQSVDLIAHVPAAFVLDAALELTAEVLPHAPDVFDLTGRQVAPGIPDFAGLVGAPVESAFVSLLKAETVTDLAQSDDGTLVREAIEAKFATAGTPDTVQDAVRALLAEAVERRSRQR